MGLMVVLALSLSAYFAYKTRSKIWRHGEPNIYWDTPLVRRSDEQDVQDWVSLLFVPVCAAFLSVRLFEAVSYRN